MKTLLALATFPMLFLASCGSHSDANSHKSVAAAPPPRKSMNERFGGGGKDPNSFQQDANGKFIARDSKRSPYESVGTDPNFAGKDFKQKEYKTGDYAKKSWWGNKDYTPKSYAGNTDGSRFQKSSALGSKGAREAGNSADVAKDYKTDDYATSSAREAGHSEIKKTSNDLIENRQKVFQQPEVIDWREQRTMSMDQSKGILRH